MLYQRAGAQAVHQPAFGTKSALKGAHLRTRTNSPPCRPPRLSQPCLRSSPTLPSLHGLHTTSPRGVFEAVSESRGRSRTCTPQGEGPFRGELAALEEKVMRNVQRVQEQTDRLLHLVMGPVESKVTTLEGRLPLLDYKISDVGDRVDTLRDDMERHIKRGGQDEEQRSSWEEAMKSEVQQQQEQGLASLRNEMIDLVTQEVAARVQEHLLRVHRTAPEYRMVAPASSYGQTMKLDAARAASHGCSRELDEAHAMVHQSLVEAGDALRCSLEDAACSLREQLEAAAEQSAQEAMRAAVDDISAELAEEVHRIGEELSAVKHEVEDITGWGQGRFRRPSLRSSAAARYASPSRLGPEFACAETPDSLSRRYARSPSAPRCWPRADVGEREVEEIARRVFGDLREEDAKRTDVVRKGDIEELKGGLEGLKTRVGQLEETALTRQVLDEAVEPIREEARRASARADAQGLDAEAAARKLGAAVEAGERLREEIQTLRGQAATKDELDELAAEFRAHQLQKKHEEDPQVAPAAQALPGGEITAATPEAEEAASKVKPEALMDVVVTQRFKSDSEDGGELHPGQSGFVSVVDKDGDILIFFENTEKAQWVFKANFGRLCFYHRRVWAAGQGGGTQSRDPDAMTLPELRDLVVQADLGLGECFSRAALVRRGHEAQETLRRAERMKGAAPLPLGRRLQYNSPTQKAWVACKVIAVDEETGTIRVDVKPGYWFSPREQALKFRPVPFAVGQEVKIRKRGSDNFVDTVVSAVRKEDDAIEVKADRGRFLSQREQVEAIREIEAHVVLRRGDTVSVVKAFSSDSQEPVELEAGQVGKVAEIDPDGDALIDFQAHKLAQWIIGSNFDRLRVINQGNAQDADGSSSSGSSNSGDEDAPRAKDPESSSSRNTYAASARGRGWSKGTSSKRRGSIVLVQEDLISDNYDPVPVKYNTLGIISDVDSEGDFLVDFKEGGRQWISGENQRKLVALPEVPEDPDEQESEDELRKGATVVVREDFVSDSMHPRKLRALDRGRVVEVDRQEDVLVDFEDAGMHWVKRAKQHKLAVIKGATAQRQRSPAGRSTPRDEPVPRWSRGEKAFFKSTTHNRWVECSVEDVRADGAITVDVKPGVWISAEDQGGRMRRAGRALFREGEVVQYNSVSFGKWVEGRIASVRQGDGAVMVDIKDGHWFSVEDQLTTLRYPPFAEGAHVEAVRDLHSDSHASVAIRRGTRGVIQQVDKEGDVLVAFEGCRKHEWVFRSKIDALRALSGGPGATVPPGTRTASPSRSPSRARVSFADDGGRAEGEPPAGLRVGARVRALHDFKSDSERPALIHSGERGEVVKVDAHGDALIQFEGRSGPERYQWVFRRSLGKLGVLHGGA